MITDKSESKNSMLRFLLGEMSDEERASFEDEFTRDTTLFHSLVELENDLLDLYAADALSPAERKRLERSFLADPDRRKRLPFSRTLMKISYPAEQAQSSAAIPTRPGYSIAWKMLSAAAALLFFAAAIGISWLLVANHRLRSELDALRQQQVIALQRTTSLQQQVAGLTRELNAGIPQDQNLVSFTLATDALRGDGKIPKLNIPSTASFVILHLIFPADSFSTYHVFLESADGSQVWHEGRANGKRLRTDNKEIVLTVPSHILQLGDYVLRITAGKGQQTEDVAGYSFSVLRR